MLAASGPVLAAARLPPLVSAASLHNMLKDVVVIDASYFLPQHKRDAQAEFLAARIPGAHGLYDHARWSDKTTGLPNMMPTHAAFKEAMCQLAVRDRSTPVVVYDSLPMFSAPRARFIMRAWGHENVAVLNGGLPEWTRAGFALETTPFVAPAPTNYEPSTYVNESVLIPLAEVEANRDNSHNRVQLLDARPADRFSGREHDARSNLASGHIPHSLNVPHSSLLDAEGRMKQGEELQAVFTAAGAKTTEPLIVSCGSGMTAAALALALETLQSQHVRLYDGSWSEYGITDAKRPVATN